MKKTPILNIRFTEMKAPGSPDETKHLLFKAKRLAAKNKALFANNGISPDIFHNNNIGYSGIQSGNYRGMQEWAAIGDLPVKALKLWFRVFKKQNPALAQNTVELIETYAPRFLDYQQKYNIPVLLINDDLAKDLNSIKDKFARHDRLEKYLYGNLQRFFKHIGFVHDKSQDFLKVNVTEAKLHKKAKPVYHHQKKTAMEVEFSCNFLLPQTLRLGQSTALGYGSTIHL